MGCERRISTGPFIDKRSMPTSDVTGVGVGDDDRLHHAGEDSIASRNWLSRVQREKKGSRRDGVVYDRPSAERIIRLGGATP